MTDQPNFSEAPASVNFYGVTKKGWNVQFTLRDADETHLIQRMGKFMAELENAYGVLPKPVGQQPGVTISPTPTQATPPPVQTQAPVLPGGQVDPAWCAVHGVAMPRHEKDGSAWYSHKLPDGSYCKGKPK